MNSKDKLAGLILGAATVVTLLSAASCGSGAYDDKRDAAGNKARADGGGSVDWTEVYLNVDGVPTIAFTCVQGLGFASPASAYGSSDSGSSGGGSPIIRLPERDAFCATKKK